MPWVRNFSSVYLKPVEFIIIIWFRYMYELLTIYNVSDVSIRVLREVSKTEKVASTQRKENRKN